MFFRPHLKFLDILITAVDRNFMTKGIYFSLFAYILTQNTHRHWFDLAFKQNTWSKHFYKNGSEVFRWNLTTKASKSSNLRFEFWVIGFARVTFFLSLWIIKFDSNYPSQWNKNWCINWLLRWFWHVEKTVSDSHSQIKSMKLQRGRRINYS